MQWLIDRMHYPYHTYGPLVPRLLTYSIPAWIGNYIHYEVGMKLLSSHTLLDVWLPIRAWINITPFEERGPWWQFIEATDLFTTGCAFICS